MERTGMTIEVKGASMAPTFSHGDRVEVRTCGARDLRKGDVIAFWRDSSLFIHRLYGRKNGLLFTKGDRCRNFDLPVEEERVFGRVVRIITAGKKGSYLESLKNVSLSRIYGIWAEIKIGTLTA